MKIADFKVGQVVSAGGRYGKIDIFQPGRESNPNGFVHVNFGNAAEWYHEESVSPLTAAEHGVGDFINVKVNADWHTITADQDAANVNCVCKYWNGREAYENLGIPEGVDLWRECDDGHEDELIPDHGEEIFTFWDGDRLYTAGRQINGGD